jgi:HK97 family phage prohead protease
MTAVLGQCDSCGQHDVKIAYDLGGIAMWQCPACGDKAAATEARRVASVEQTALGVVSTNAATRLEHKVDHAEVKTAMLAEPTTDTGTFTGYLAAFGRDHGGDTIMPGAMSETVAAFNAGKITWHLTDAHSEKASDVVATVRSAVVDHHGLRVEAAWMPTERAQALRAMVRAGSKLGMSIDYFPDVSRPDGAGGRFLDKVTVVGGAITPKPMNAAATITEGKHAVGGSARVLTVAQATAEDAARRERETPQRRQEDATLSAASWPPPGLFDRETSLALIRGGAQAKARRELAEGDPARARAQARRDRDNAYSSALSSWLANPPTCGHGCPPGRCVYR